MKEKISALGQYIVKQTGKNFNFKMIKPDGYYKGVLFSYHMDFFHYGVAGSHQVLLWYR